MKQILITVAIFATLTTTLQAECSKAELMKLIDKGFNKAEITSICNITVKSKFAHTAPKSKLITSANKYLCKKNSDETCLKYGNFLYKNKKYKEAEKYYIKACYGSNLHNKKIDKFCNHLAYKLYYGDKGFQKNISRAIGLFSLSCHVNNNEDSCEFIAKEACSKGYKEACKIKKLQINCYNDDANSCSDLGFIYKNSKDAFGYIASRDKAIKFLTKANKLYQKYCSTGNGEACYYLGISYKFGTVVKKDTKETIRLFKKACDSGFKKACGQLGAIYYFGEEVTQNYYKARPLFKKACDNNDSFSCEMLGSMYENGEGVKINHTKGIEFSKKACKLGAFRACVSVK